ncbi:hypothetical protein MUK42_23189 [Musa troglodytarum]|uniref:Uncharacterized protein n=1 Tax=Musa troglodytarum TaxID=320322 RepID=A0A9E7GJF1_9LILI|nr:hypothetical protein MUK42_23189 [Musa troglodytarum]
MKTKDVVLGVEILHYDCLNIMMGSIQLILMNLCACSTEILQVCLVLLLLELIQHQQGFAKLKIFSAFGKDELDVVEMHGVDDRVQSV